MSYIQLSEANILTKLGAILGGIFTGINKVVSLNIQLNKNMLISIDEVVRIAQGACIGALVGGVVGYFVKLVLDKLFKKNKAS